MSKKIQIHFHEQEFIKAKDRLKKDAHLLDEALKLIHEITNGEVLELSLSKCEANIQAQTGYPNIMAGATLLDKDKQYKKLLELHQKTNFNDANYILAKDTHEIDISVLQALEERYKVYLPEDLNDKWKELSKAVEILNKVGAGCLKAIDLTGVEEAPYKINAYKLGYV